MKKRLYKLIIYISCVILLIMFVNNILINCDVHVMECNHEKCIRCSLIHNMQEILKNLFVIIGMAALFINIKLVDRVKIFFKNIIYTNLVLMHVILNE